MPASYFKLVLALVGTTEARRQAILEGTGIAPEAVPRLDEVTLGQQLRQIRNTNRLLPPGWGLAVTSRFQTPAHGPLGFGAISAPTLGDALALVARFAHVRNPSFEGRLRRSAGEVRVVLRPRCELLDEERGVLVESFLLSIQAILESVLSRNLDGGRIEVVGRPAHARRYRDYFHVEACFDAGEDALVLPAPWLGEPSPLANRDMYDACRMRLEGQDERLRGDRFVVAQVEGLLTGGDDAGLPIEAAAKRLGVSPRTLIRRLRTSGLTYRELRDDHRRRRAERLLGGTPLTMAEISARLGYGDASNFARACHRWFGCAPGFARGELRGRRPVERDALGGA